MMNITRPNHRPDKASAEALLKRLPCCRGQLEMLEPLAKHCWFGVGGVAEIMFSPEDEEDLAVFLSATDSSIPVLPIGAGSNLLVRDGGVAGVIVNLARNMNRAEIINTDGGTEIIAEAGIADAALARLAARHGLGGLAFLVGIPGTIGGGLRMNAGAYGYEFADIVITATALDRDGRRHQLTTAEMGMTYRHSETPQDWIFTAARLRTSPAEPAALRQQMKKIIAARADAQPQGVRTGGSTFANPEGRDGKTKAWQLIDAAGGRGLCNGRAQVSEKHCNFLINTGGATASELETLGETLRQRVAETSGVDLRWEIQRIGVPASSGQQHHDNPGEQHD